MEYVLEVLRSARKVAEEAEVFSVSSRVTPVHFEANRIKRIETKENTSIALRIIKEGRIGFATATGPRMGGDKPRPYKEGKGEMKNSLQGRGMLGNLVDMAVETSQFGSPANFQFPSAANYPQVSVFDPGVERIRIEKMVELGEELVAKVRTHAPDILCDVEVVKGMYSVHIINSRGGEASYDKSFFGLSLEGLLIQGTDMLFVGDSEDSCSVPSTIVDILADRVIRQLELAKEKATVSTKLLPVIFTPRGVAGALLPSITLAFNGKMVLEGASRLKGKLGEQVFDKGLNLWDDATIAYGVESRPCDDEGVPSQRLPLVTNGVVTNFLYDLQTAALAGTKSNGHGERMGGFPQPAISSLIIDEGTVSFQDMVKDMKEGLIVEELIGSGQGDILSGDFGGNILLGCKVENGKIVGRVKDTMISGNVYQVLREPVVIGSETRWVNGILRTPPLYCPQVSVAAKGC